MKKTPYCGRVAIVTGASSGIGRELSLQLAAQGAAVVLAARTVEKLETVGKECAALGENVLVVPTDVSRTEDCRLLIEKTVEQFGRVDALFNNAGYGVTADLQDLEDIALFDDQMRVNFNGSMYCTYYALPHLLKEKGMICAVSSIAGLFPMAGSSIYNASKFAMRGFFDALRQELQDKGVSVTIIYPGYVVTEFAANVMDRNGSARGEKALAMYTKKMMTAETCARIILKATARRKRSVTMTLEANIGQWLKMFFPRLFDRLIRGYRDKRNEQIRKLLDRL